MSDTKTPAPDVARKLLDIVTGIPIVERGGSQDYQRGFLDGQRFTRDVCADRMHAALSPGGEREGDGWRPIETAPKDGTLIDVWVGGEFPGRLTDVSWRKPTDSEWWTHGGDTIKTPKATWHDPFGPLGKDRQPTHWQPLPAPPLAPQEAGR